MVDKWKKFEREKIEEPIRTAMIWNETERPAIEERAGRLWHGNTK